jgi:hypothetical protein
MNEAHIVVGIGAIVVNGVAACAGAWAWWRANSSPLFWRLLRAGQAAVVLAIVVGGIFELIRHRAPSLHLLYGVLPLLVSFFAEGLRASSAQMVLDKYGYASAREVGRLSDDDQRAVVVEILRREMGVMTLAAIVIVGLLARAAGTG